MSARRVALGVLLGVTAGVLAPAASGHGADHLALAAAGERWWTTSPDPANPVACATCHHEPNETRGWAASFPKFKPQPPPHARVMTLLQANADAVRRHYRLADPLPVARAITAYLTAHGAGAPLSPGIAAGQPVFPARLRALGESVARGRRLYVRHCAACHAAPAGVSAVAGFPRGREPGVEPLEAFLDGHVSSRGLLAWDSPALADLVSYLVAGRADGLTKEEPLAAWILVLTGSRAAGAATVISGTVKNKAGQPLSGLALLEKGEIHNNVWDRGARVDASGRFRIEVAAGGQYGLHVYASGYIYGPQPVRVETGKTLEVSVVLVAEPTRANDPVIKKAGFFPGAERQGKVTLIKLDVADPNDDLGPQVLAFNAPSGHAYALQPPRRMRDLKENFPPGVYQLEVDTAGAPANPRDWHFVVADHQCNTTDILSFPHEPRRPRVIAP